MPACICAPEDCRGDKAEPGWGELYWGIWGFLCMYPRSCAMLDWFMEGCRIVSDWPLGGRGGI